MGDHPHPWGACVGLLVECEQAPGHVVADHHAAVGVDQLLAQPQPGVDVLRGPGRGDVVVDALGQAAPVLVQQAGHEELLAALLGHPLPGVGEVEPRQAHVVHPQQPGQLLGLVVQVVVVVAVADGVDDGVVGPGVEVALQRRRREPAHPGRQRFPGSGAGREHVELAALGQVGHEAGVVGGDPRRRGRQGSHQGETHGQRGAGARWGGARPRSGAGLVVEAGQGGHRAIGHRRPGELGGPGSAARHQLAPVGLVGEAALQGVGHGGHVVGVEGGRRPGQHLGERGGGRGEAGATTGRGLGGGEAEALRQRGQHEQPGLLVQRPQHLVGHPPGEHHLLGTQARRCGVGRPGRAGVVVDVAGQHQLVVGPQPGGQRGPGVEQALGVLARFAPGHGQDEGPGHRRQVAGQHQVGCLGRGRGVEERRHPGPDDRHAGGVDPEVVHRLGGGVLGDGQHQVGLGEEPRAGVVAPEPLGVAGVAFGLHQRDQVVEGDHDGQVVGQHVGRELPLGVGPQLEGRHEVEGQRPLGGLGHGPQSREGVPTQ